jgi:hypothetical protein
LGILIRDAGSGELRFRQDGAPTAVPVPPPNQQQQQNGAVNSHITDNVTGLLLGKLIDRAIPSLAPQSPGELLTQAFAIADRLKPAVPQYTVEQIAARVVERLGPQQQSAPPSPPADPVESAMKSIETAMKFQELMEKIGGKNGGGHGKPRWYESLPQIFEGAKELIPEVVRGVGQVRQMYSTPQNGRPANGVYSPVAQSAPVQPVQGEILPTGASDGQQAPGNGENSAMPVDLRFMLDQYLAGVKGYDTALFLVQARPGGLKVFRDIEKLGAENCVSMLAMRPEARAFVSDPAGRTAVRTWLEDFISFDADEQDESESPEATAAAGAGA